MPGKRQAKRKASMPRTVGMVIFRILAIGACIFALLIFVGGLSTDFLTCTIIALIISFIGWMLWVIGDMIHDPEKIRAEQRAARAAKDPSIVPDEDSERERKRRPMVTGTAAQTPDTRNPSLMHRLRSPRGRQSRASCLMITLSSTSKPPVSDTQMTKSSKSVQSRSWGANPLQNTKNSSTRNNISTHSSRRSPA